MTQEVYHIPALLPQTLAALDIKPGGTYVDATFGGGGHSRAILGQLGPEGRLLAFDQDEDALAGAPDDPRFTMVYGNFRFLRNFLRFYDAGKADGILADLGVSFHHFDDAGRGFSFRSDARLDMRMNRHAALSAYEVVNEYSEERLADILHLYGEVAKARPMARAIVRARSQAPVATVNGLLEAISPLIDPRREKKDLACVFQALRIEVNGELDALRSFLEQTAEALRPGGRLAIITYHSLEDRLVKNFMRAGNFTGRVETDIYGHADTPYKLLTSKPVVPDEAEIEANPRSRSAKLRVATRL
ncbi:MAG: 16S rRNA (cytosine(1402)-N(4))-methyltransferase RsmH [Muribaculaceae bacterium]|nr:16S rRNA (cytosine(1402)-N(4))-methyltransferase RsmH [Muribaculaceae bacterium]